MTDDFVPNSFQTPNAYIDRCMAFLTPEEWKVLSYFCRRIFGFNKRQDRVAIPQLVDGITGKNGEVLDYGTGLCETTVRKALEALRQFRIVLRVAENDPAKNQGALYELQLDGSRIDVAGLKTRFESWQEKGSQQAARARQGKKNKEEVVLGPNTTPNAVIPPVMPQQDGGITPQQDGSYYGVIPTINRGNTDQNPDSCAPAPENLFDESTPEGRRRKSTLEAMQRGQAEHSGYQAEIVRLFRISPNWKTKASKDFLLWLKDVPRNQTLAQFAAWWWENDWRGKRAQAPTLAQIQELWLQAFPGEEEKAPVDYTAELEYIRKHNQARKEGWLDKMGHIIEPVEAQHV